MRKLLSRCLSQSEKQKISSLQDLDLCCKKYEDFVSNLGNLYPGFLDTEYMEWLSKVRKLPSKVLEPEHKIDYSPVHNSTWTTIYKPLIKLHYKFACEEHNRQLSELEMLKLFNSSEIPQFSDINKYLKSKTGFRLVNIGGMINSRTFLCGLAFGIFYATQFIRHTSVPFYSPEPDLVHDLLGHVPLFANQDFANFSRAIGKLSLDADDKIIEKIAKIYFFIIEFGIVGEKILGAGILGSCKEIERVKSQEAVIEKYDLEKLLQKELILSEYQPSYMDIGSIDALPGIIQEFYSRVY
jgi:phenylalanine-4-hydroxylase